MMARANNDNAGAVIRDRGGVASTRSQDRTGRSSTLRPTIVFFFFCPPDIGIFCRLTDRYFRLVMSGCDDSTGWLTMADDG